MPAQPWEKWLIGNKVALETGNSRQTTVSSGVKLGAILSRTQPSCGLVPLTRTKFPKHHNWARCCWRMFETNSFRNIGQFFHYNDNSFMPSLFVDSSRSLIDILLVVKKTTQKQKQKSFVNVNRNWNTDSAPMKCTFMCHFAPLQLSGSNRGLSTY